MHATSETLSNPKADFQTQFPVYRTPLFCRSPYLVGCFYSAFNKLWPQTVFVQYVVVSATPSTKGAEL